MPFRPNYRQERAQKARNREAKKEEKLRRREEASAQRKALRERAPGSDAPPDGASGTSGDDNRE